MEDLRQYIETHDLYIDQFLRAAETQDLCIDQLRREAETRDMAERLRHETWQGIYDELMVTRKNIYDELLETRKYKTSLEMEIKCIKEHETWQGIYDELMVTRKNIYDELMETRKHKTSLEMEIKCVKEALEKEKLGMKQLRRETGVWDEEPESWNRMDFTRVARTRTPVKGEEELSEEELSEEEDKQEYLRQEQLRERGITSFGNGNTDNKTKGILNKDKTQTKKTKGILKKDKSQTNSLKYWMISSGIPRKEYLRNSEGVDYWIE